MAADGLITGPADLGLALRPTELVIFGDARGGAHAGRTTGLFAAALRTPWTT
jgi:hypothetical protein